MKFFHTAIILLLFSAPDFAQNQQPADTWQCVLTIQDADPTASPLSLTFGKATGATSGLDTWLGEQELPPYPPSGIFDARFLYEAPFADYTSLTDIRSAALTNAIWKTKVQKGGAAYRMQYTWNPALLPPQGSFLLQDPFNGIVLNVNMRTQSSAVVENSGLNTIFIVGTGLNSVQPLNNAVSNRFTLQQNYPNPFNPETNISYYLPYSAPIIVAVYNAIGELKAELINGMQGAGWHSLAFHAAHLPSGMYYCMLIADGRQHGNIPMLLIK